jgi:hypothetical protein
LEGRRGAEGRERREADERTAAGDRSDGPDRPIRRPRPTDLTAVADRSDGRGRPITRPWTAQAVGSDGRGLPRRTARVRTAAAVQSDGRGGSGGRDCSWGQRGRPIGRCARGRLQGRPPSAVAIKGVGPTILPHLSGRAGRFGIFCLIACAPSSALIHFYFIGFSLTHLIVCSNWGRCLG